LEIVGLFVEPKEAGKPVPEREQLKQRNADDDMGTERYEQRLGRSWLTFALPTSARALTDARSRPTRRRRPACASFFELRLVR